MAATENELIARLNALVEEIDHIGNTADEVDGSGQAAVLYHLGIDPEQKDAIKAWIAEQVQECGVPADSPVFSEICFVNMVGFCYGVAYGRTVEGAALGDGNE